MQLTAGEISYISAGRTPDTMIGSAKSIISFRRCTLYRIFALGQYQFNVRQLPMKEKHHPNGYVERCSKTGTLGRSIYQRYHNFPHYQHVFGHFKVDTAQDKTHHGAVMTLAECQSKVMVALNIYYKTDEAINHRLDQ